MFEHLTHKKILVSGPQRSGTRICSKMISFDTRLTHIDEIDRYPDREKTQHLLDTMDEFVLHCPTASRWLHEFEGDFLVVFMLRSLEDIAESQDRINWNKEQVELEKYGATEGPVAQIKYHFWEQTQKPAITHYLEVEYESLSRHPLWVPKEKRKHFFWNQTEDHWF